MRLLYVLVSLMTIFAIVWYTNKFSDLPKSHNEAAEGQIRVPDVLNLLRLVGFYQCPAASEKITVPETQLYYSNQKDICITPTMIVIHYTGGWYGAYETLSILDNRGLSCHLGIDQNERIQMLDFFHGKVERAACTGGYNDKALNIEISGTDFDSIFKDPTNPYYSRLSLSTENALETACWTRRTYGILLSQIYGHNELDPNKHDPGFEYIKYFRDRLKAQCP